jgi:hypothetical protein
VRKVICSKIQAGNQIIGRPFSLTLASCGQFFPRKTEVFWKIIQPAPNIKVFREEGNLSKILQKDL